MQREERLSGLWDGVEVVLRREKRRSVAMQVLCDGALAVTAPAKLPQADIRAVLLRHEKPLLRRIMLMREVDAYMRPVRERRAVAFEGALIPAILSDDAGARFTDVRRTDMPLADVRADVRLADVRLADVLLRAGIPWDEAVAQWYRAQARRILPPMVAHWAQRLGIAPMRVSIRMQKKRWGSCAVSGNISLNALLVAAPPEVMLTVVLHELTHRMHPHHQRSFYQALSQHAPRYREHQQWLHAHGAWLLQYYGNR